MSLPSTEFQAPALGEVSPVWEAGALLGEGLCWSPALQALYWVDIHGHRLMRWHVATGERREWRFGESISAVAERANGRGLVVALHKGPAFFDPETGDLQRLHEPEPHHPGNRFNDGKCDRHGRFWAGSMDTACQAPTGSLYCLHAEGQHTRLRCAWPANFAVVNGPAWSLDGRTVWVNETARGVVHVARFEPETGELGEQRPWLRFAKGDGYPDGMTVDARGRLWIAHWAGACVTCHAPDDGRELARLTLPTSNVTNVIFGGPDLRTLYITTAAGELSDEQRASQPLAGALFTATTDAQGLPTALFAG
ncbi:SMP-30/gluconolactonase/LRE family protein [Ideonella sp. BN130291]|uniref:SMP-30/gluconolactonase/LRE family protein n=1 Tax=Ideonella sp. BN130291 TaxID=3112940 RepID=UPI002E26D886|nr:SMP-30/gluconolactonase/LRE family protein [Ideonella sp. BN130291]